MILCGVKVTHDAGVALIDDGRLVFSVEMEKLQNNERHAHLEELGAVEDVLADHGYTLADVDHVVIDGWRKPIKARHWNGQEIPLLLAPYRRGLRSASLFDSYRFRTADLDYLSYSHYAGHVASAYCTSPFAGDSAYVLCWDGRMAPFLYHVDSVGARTVGPLSPLLGDTYHSLAQLFPPFGRLAPGPPEPYDLALPGKIMAYCALGEPRDEALKVLRVAYEAAYGDVIGSRPLTDRLANELNGQAILEHMVGNLDRTSASAADMIASVQAFLGELLLSSLTDLVRRDEARTENLCLTGGCALNIKWNRMIRDSGVARRVYVPPFPNDAGSAIGAACCGMMELSGRRRLEWSPYSGPALAPPVARVGWSSRSCPPEELAALLHSSGDAVVFLDGRAELGPRALGHRSILAPAVDVAMKDFLNGVKDREDYRPVAPICLQSLASEVFDPGSPDPYMLFDHVVRPEWTDRVPAIRHLDGSARLQTVPDEDGSPVVRVLAEYQRLSAIPLLCNTSANAKGRGFFPDVGSAMDWGRIPRVWSDGVLYERGGEA
jgi:carbamoyltransferase